MLQCDIGEGVGHNRECAEVFARIWQKENRPGPQQGSINTLRGRKGTTSQNATNPKKGKVLRGARGKAISQNSHKHTCTIY